MLPLLGHRLVHILPLSKAFSEGSEGCAIAAQSQQELEELSMAIYDEFQSI